MKVAINPSIFNRARDCSRLSVDRMGETISHEMDDPNVTTLEKEIDALVYELYGLTPEEIALVEGKG